MATIREMIRRANADGYTDNNAEAKVCQDIVLKALSESSFCRNATIKGGVVMRSITGDSRRATQDMDIDFIRYSISDESIRAFMWFSGYELLRPGISETKRMHTGGIPEPCQVAIMQYKKQVSRMASPTFHCGFGLIVI